MRFYLAAAGTIGQKKNELYHDGYVLLYSVICHVSEVVREHFNLVDQGRLANTIT